MRKARNRAGEILEIRDVHPKEAKFGFNKKRTIAIILLMVIISFGVMVFGVEVKN